MKFVAFLRLTDQRVIDPFRYGFGADQRIQDLHQPKVEDECFVLTQSHIETFIENSALEIKPDRTLMLRYELKSIGQCAYATDVLSRFLYDGHREDVRNHIVTATVAALGVPAVSLVLGWAALFWAARGFTRD